MSIITGTITKIKAVEEGTTRQGKPYRKRSMEVEGEWYGGFLNSDNSASIEGLAQGDVVEIDYVMNGKYKNFNTVVVTQKSTVPETVAKAAPVVQENNYQLRMNFVGAQHRAIEYIAVAKACGSLKLPAKEAQSLAALDALLVHYTDKFARESWEATDPSISDAEVAEQIEGEAFVA